MLSAPLADLPLVFVDVETTGLQWYAHALFMAQFFDPEDEECFQYPTHCPNCDGLVNEEGCCDGNAAAGVGGCGFDIEPEPKAVIFRHPEERADIQRWLDKDAYFRAWNSKFDFHHLESEGYTLPPRDRWEDGMLVAHVLDERRSVALQAVGDKMFGTEPWPEGAGIELEKAVKAWISGENKARRKHSKETGEKFVIANYSDVPAEDMRRGRAAAENIIPQDSRSPGMLMELIPELAGKVVGAAMNVPVPNGSAVDLVCWHEKKVTVTAINEVARTAIAAKWKGIMAYETEPIVSSDIAHSSFSSTFDSLATMVLGENVSKTLSWYDAGWGYAHRAVELLERFVALDREASR